MDLQEQARQWRARVAAHRAAVAELPADRPRHPPPQAEPQWLDSTLDAACVDALRAREGNATDVPWATLLGTFTGLLHCLTQQDVLLMALSTPGADLHLHTLRTASAPDRRLRTLVAQARLALHEARAAAPAPADPEAPRAALVPVWVVLDAEGDAVAAAAPTPLPGGFEWVLRLQPRPDGGVRLACHFDAALYSPATMQRWLALYLGALARFADDGDISLAQACALGAQERALLERFNATESAYDRSARVESLVAAQALATPDAVALVAGDDTLSYRELEQRASALALALQAAGVGSGELVGLCCARQAHLLPALLGVLKAGAGYVPLDPGYPRERLDFMAQDARLRVIVADQSTQALWQAHPVALVLADGALPAGAAPAPRGGPEDVAYAIYTSGSTGTPKGVPIPHRAVVNLLGSLREEPGMHAGHVVLAITTLSFDIAVSELILPLTVGARVVLAERAQSADGALLRALVEREQVNFIDATPSTWRLLLEAGWAGRPDLLAICTGEPLPPDLARQLLPRVGVLWNGYGPTETTVWSSFHRVDDAQLSRIPIGRPIANTRFQVLDAELQPLPVGVEGELCIGGDGVAPGYLHRPDLTAERFVPDPTGRDPQQRWYRTGDRGRWRADGVLECLGRIDHQVKVRGHRIELGEIESQLNRHPAVAHCVVVTREDRPGDVRLVAYVVGRGPVPAGADLRRHLAAFLPDYMLPQHVVTLATLPLLPNGKLDRHALPAPSLAAPRSTAPPPARPEQAELAQVWAEVLGIETHEIRPTDTFFDLGGDSLLAVRAVQRAAERMGFRVEAQRYMYESLAQLSVPVAAPTRAAPAPRGLLRRMASALARRPARD